MEGIADPREGIFAGLNGFDLVAAGTGTDNQSAQ